MLVARRNVWADRPLHQKHIGYLHCAHTGGIELSANSLKGVLQSVDFDALTYLEVFDVSDNQLSGSLPYMADVAALTTLDVSGNTLTGSIPPLLWNTNLKVSIPAAIC